MIELHPADPIHPGLELRTLPVPPGTVRELRVDPARIRLRVVCAPDAPKRISEWQDTLAPLAVINGGYFEASNEASALTISDSVVTGQSYAGFGAMLAVTEAGTVVALDRAGRLLLVVNDRPQWTLTEVA